MIDKEAARAWRNRLRHVLNTQWDPIGGCPDDEYDAYAGKIAAMVREGTSDAALREYLNWAEAENMGVRPDSPRLDRTIAAIRALGPIP